MIEQSVDRAPQASARVEPNEPSVPGLHVGLESLHPDRSLDFQLNRWVAYAGAPMIADIRSMGYRLGSLDEWKRAFLELHDRALAEGRTLAAALHLRSAEFFMIAGDPRKPAARREIVALLRAAYGVAAPSSIPYAGAMLPVYRLTPTQPRDTVVIFGGFDSYIEEFFALLVALRDDGFDVVAFEGPGQGAVLEEGGVPMTVDWHLPVAAVLDAFGLDDVTLVGISLGGCLAIRAAALEPRVHRVVAFDVLADFRECLLAQIPGPRRSVLRALLALRADRAIDALVRRDHRPIVEWGVAQGMHVFGVATPHAFFHEAGRYVTRDLSPRVLQDVLLCAGADDHYVPLRQLADQKATLTRARSVTSRVFTRAESGQSHCQIGNLPLALRTIAQWIETVKPSRQAPRTRHGVRS